VPRFSVWIRSLLRGEVSTAGIEARRRAGMAAYSLAEEAEAVEGDERGTCLFRLCAWNAFALQTIAETLLDVDAADHPATAGYVPASTFRFVDACLDEVPDWIRRARVVEGDPDARVGAALPARLPRWRHDEPTTPGELHGLRRAYESLEPRVESSLQEAVAAAPASRSREIGELRRVRAEMASAAEYAETIRRRNAGPVDRGEARWRLLDALEHAYLLGQLLAVPTLVEVERVREDRDEELPLAQEASWLQIGPGWPVVDSDDVHLGVVQRVRGDRATGAFEGLDVDSSIASGLLHVPAGAVAGIGAGEIRLSVRRAELRD